MNERPEQPPEGKIIAAALERSGLSIRKAAERAGISYGRWRQVTTGVQHVSPGEFAAVRAPAATLARMAAAAGVTPEQMETEGQRPDAAEKMRSAPLPAAVNSARAAGIDAADLDNQWIRVVLEKIGTAEEIHGENPTGSQVFHGEASSAYEAALWDDRRLSEASKVLGIATLRAWAARDEASRQDNGRHGTAGLVPALTLARG